MNLSEIYLRMRLMVVPNRPKVLTYPIDQSLISLRLVRVKSNVA